METKEVTVKEYIELLPKDIKPFVEHQPYFAFFIIASGIEFMGKCINSEKNWQKEQMSRTDFENAIKQLDSFDEYRKYLKGNSYKIDLYSGLRCGLLHAMLPKSNILPMRGNEPINVDSNNKLRLSIKTFYDDFCNACKEILSSKCDSMWKGKSKEDVFLYIIDNQNQGYYQASGSTITNFATSNNNN